MKMTRKSILFAVIFALTAGLHAQAAFSGYSGGKLNYAANPESADYDPDLSLQAFFQGLFNFNPNMWDTWNFLLIPKTFLAKNFFIKQVPPLR